MRRKIVIGIISLILLACLISTIILVHSNIGFHHGM